MIAAGTILLIEAPNGESLEGALTQAIEDFEAPFVIRCEDGEFRVEQPWDCEIEVMEAA